MKRLLYFSVLFVLISVDGFAQLTGQLIEKSLKYNVPFTVTKYSTKEGLPQSQVIKIMQKKDGSLIIYTANGIVEFDGYSFTEFIKDKGYRKQFFRNLYFRPQEEELIGFDENHRLFRIKDSLSEIKWPFTDIHYTMLSGDTLIAFHYSGRLHGYDLKRKCFVNMPLFRVCGTSKIVISAVEHNGIFYYATGDGLYYFRKNSGECGKIVDYSCSVIEVNPHTQKVCAAYNDKLLIIEGTEVIAVHTNNRLKKKAQVYDLDFPSGEDVYMATSVGLYAYEFGEFDFYGNNDGIPSEHIVSVHADSLSECMFVGTGEKGLLKLQYKNNYSYTKTEGLGISSVNSIVRAADGSVVVSYSCCDMYKLKIDTAFAYTPVKANYASASIVDDKIFAGTWGAGVKIFDGPILVDSIKAPLNLPSGQVQACFKDTKGNYWIGTGNGIASGKTIHGIRPVLKEIKETVICLYEMKDGTVCAGVVGGAYLIKDLQVITKIDAEDGFEGKEVRSFYEDDEGKLWIGSYNGGIYCYHKGKLTSLNKMKNCLLDADAFSLAKDQYNNLFMTSNHGLWRIAEKDLNDFYYGKLDYLIPFHFTEETGILNTEFNGGFQSNYLETKNSHFYFPSLEGVVMTLQGETPFRKLSPQISLVIVDNADFTAKSHVFDKNTRSIKFNFRCVNFSAKNNVYFQYRLQGETNTDWSTPQKNYTVGFDLLPSGSYTFQVRAIDGFNDRSPQVVSYSFRIEPWFYEKLWFRLLFIALSAALIVSIVWLRFNVIRKKEKEKARIRHRIAELELNVLHAQMNPHFIFNSLNSLKYFLNVGDIKSADSFTDNFSYLLRKVMVYSDEKLISIEEEIAMLVAYIELEKMRMNNRFEYRIEADPGIDKKLIPTFMLQPFVENAIKHGFAHKEGKCNLAIRIRYMNNTICCIIDDDGVGRKKAKEIRATHLSHESKGISNVLERIAIKKDSYGKNISIEIIDKKDGEGNSKGTMVVINIEEINDTHYNS